MQWVIVKITKKQVPERQEAHLEKEEEIMKKITEAVELVEEFLEELYATYANER